MSSQRTTHTKNLDPGIIKRMEKHERHNQWVEHTFRWILHQIERVIAVITILALLTALALEVYTMFTDPGYFSDVTNILHNLLSIVVGLEFVRMIIDTTPANILEVLTVAITRHVILSHDNPWSNIASMLCIAGLFAIRRFLIRRSELQEEMVEVE